MSLFSRSSLLVLGIALEVLSPVEFVPSNPCAGSVLPIGVKPCKIAYVPLLQFLLFVPAYDAQAEAFI